MACLRGRAPQCPHLVMSSTPTPSQQSPQSKIVSPWSSTTRNACCIQHSACFRRMRQMSSASMCCHARLHRSLDCFIPSEFARTLWPRLRRPRLGAMAEHNIAATVRPLPDCCTAMLTEPGGMARSPPPQACCGFCPARHQPFFLSVSGSVSCTDPAYPPLLAPSRNRMRCGLCLAARS